MEQSEIVKSHILSTTVDMLNHGFEVESMTIRKIAQKANVSVGLINYHFGSKDRLLLLAIHTIIQKVTEQKNIYLLDSSLPPKDRLRKFLMDITDIVIQYRSFSKIMLKEEILSMSFATPEHILEVLKDIKPMASEFELKWLSIAAVAPFQHVFLKEAGFYTFMGSESIDFQTLIDQHLTLLGL